jgi:hypothetical protein
MKWCFAASADPGAAVLRSVVSRAARGFGGISNDLQASAMRSTGRKLGISNDLQAPMEAARFAWAREVANGGISNDLQAAAPATRAGGSTDQ